MLVQLGAGGMFVVGIAPEILGGGQLGVGLRWPRWSLELDARGTLPVETRPAGPTIIRIYIRIYALSGAIAPCFRPGPFAFCGLVAGGWSKGMVVNRTYPVDGSVPFLNLGVRVGVESPPIAGRFTFRLDADVAASLRPSLIDGISYALWDPGGTNATFGAWLFTSL
jgi:hypothetical protein